MRRFMTRIWKGDAPALRGLYFRFFFGFSVLYKADSQRGFRYMLPVSRVAQAPSR